MVIPYWGGGGGGEPKKKKTQMIGLCKATIRSQKKEQILGLQNCSFGKTNAVCQRWCHLEVIM